MPTLVWTTFYIVVKLCDEGMTIDETLKSIISIPFSAQGHGVLWFMYTLAGLYLLAPILHAWLRNTVERNIRFYLLLWLVSMCYPILRIVADVNDTTTGILYYFSGYVGYFLLGYWMQRYGNKISFRIATLLMCVSVAAPVVVKLTHWDVDFYSMFWYLSVFVAVQCVFWWKCMKRMRSMVLADKIKHFVSLLSNLSFGIYLSHIFIMRHLVWNIPSVIQIHSQLLQTLIVALLTFMLSLVVSMAFGITPLGNAIIGWRKT